VGGDIILTVQGTAVKELTDREKIREILNRVPPSGGEFTMTVLRLGHVIEVISKTEIAVFVRRHTPPR
jgi:hypothetical protein